MIASNGRGIVCGGPGDPGLTVATARNVALCAAALGTDGGACDASMLMATGGWIVARQASAGWIRTA
jgi:hypothetical protein